MKNLLEKVELQKVSAPRVGSQKILTFARKFVSKSFVSQGEDDFTISAHKRKFILTLLFC